MSFRVAPVTGSDGHAPLYDPESSWRVWAYHELYLGQDGKLKYVPKVRDHVKDVDTLRQWRVISVDPNTLIPTLEPLNQSESDLLTGPSADSYRVYLDTSVVPHILAVDARLKVGGTQTQYAKIYLGSDISATGKVISFLFDSNGQYLTDRIPLELAAIDSHTNHAIKVVSKAHTKAKLKDGERVTLVVFNDQGHVVAIRSLLVVNTSFIRNISQGTKYISHISLKSPFLSQSNPQLLEYPLNVPIQAFNMYGTVHYSDGSSQDYPVDGTKFKLLGLEPYLSTVIGQKVKLVLSYKLAPNESTYAAHSSQGKFVTSPYDLITTPQDGAYTVKIYAYPIWVDSTTGYRLTFYLTDLSRSTCIDVTPYVYFNSNSDVYDPLGYNKNQFLSIRINLKDVSSSLKSYIHTQTLFIALKNPGDSPHTRWLTASDPNQNPYYGNHLLALTHQSAPNLSTVNLSSSYTTLSEWLTATYLATRPLTDPKKESSPPEPTHIRIHNGSLKHEFPISDYNKDLPISGTIPNHSTLIVEFIKKTNQDTLTLSVAAFAVQHN